MKHRFTSNAQRALFAAVLNELAALGYTGRLLRENYRFADHFTNRDTVSVPAAAFGQQPPDPNTACFAVLLSNHESGATLVNKFRALGAPRALEVTDDSVFHWRMSANVKDSDRQQVINAEDLSTTFQRNHDQWKPAAVLRAKNIASPGSRQLDFVDVGLIPALESHIREKLDPLLKEVLSDAQSNYELRHGTKPDSDKLFRLVFRSLTGKTMHDMGLQPFASINGPASPQEFLNNVATHYNDPHPILDDPEIQQIILKKFWGGMSFAHLSSDVLAYVWENTLVTDEMRTSQAIHATPPNVARFVVRNLIDAPPENGRTIVEPCCGSGTFLIAALQRLRGLLPPSVDDLNARHRYFAEMLAGYDTETFGLEVAHSSLVLADFPNRDGWVLRNEDVFAPARQSPSFYSALKSARFVVCNPPFGNFSDNEMRIYRSSTRQKPIELFTRILHHVPVDAEIGFVLPHQIIDGHSYRQLRRLLADRYKTLDLVHLPEGVFEKQRFPSALLVARDPSPTPHTCRVSFSEVSDPRSFVETGVLGRTASRQRSAKQVERSVGIVELDKLWQFLSSYSTLASATDDIARGVEWETFDKTSDIADEPRSGFLPGFHTSKYMRCFEAPPLVFLNADPKKRRRNAWDKPWHRPKTVCNAVRKSQVGPWKICAWAVDLNLLCTQNFTVLWPRYPWTARVLAAILNGPVASAFMTSHETWKHLTKENLSELPIPELTESELSSVESMVRQYEKLAALKRDGYFDNDTDSQLRSTLLRIDSAILSAYGLPSTLKNTLLRFFEGEKRSVAVSYDITLLGRLDTNSRSSDIGSAPSWDVVARALHEDRV